MSKFEYIVFRCRVNWNGGEYRLSIMNGKDKDTDWVDADVLGRQGWEFVSFVPDGHEFISDTFTEGELTFVRVALFKRAVLSEDE